MIKLKSAIVVEGKYDKIRLSNIVSAPIFTTDGFRLFKNKEKIALLRAVAQKHGLILLTDSDSAGNFIRSRLKTYIGEEHIINVYLPQIKGKEKRKSAPSAEGFLGVEGTGDEIIEAALSRFISEDKAPVKEITRSDFYFWGLMGDGSVEKRKKICKNLGLPQNLSTTALLDAVNLLYSCEELENIIKEVL